MYFYYYNIDCSLDKISPLFHKLFEYTYMKKIKIGFNLCIPILDYLIDLINSKRLYYLEYIDISSNFITIEGIYKLLKTLNKFQCQNIKYLILSNNNIEDNKEESNVIFYKHILSNLEVLDISSNLLLNSKLNMIIQLIPTFNNLQYLLLGSNRIGNLGIQKLLFVLSKNNNIKLKYLDISGNNIRHCDKILKYLSIINTSQLNNINLNDNRIGNRNIKILIKSFLENKWPLLEVLQIRCI